jgi:hypothetical protein
MAVSLESRIERQFLEIEQRMRGKASGRPQSHPDKLVPVQQTSYVDDQIEKYEFYLNEIMRNVREARSRAPCSGCKKTVESIKIVTLGSLTALAIYKEMSLEGRTRADFSDEEIERIKKEVERKYINY